MEPRKKHAYRYLSIGAALVYLITTFLTLLEGQIPFKEILILMSLAIGYLVFSFIIKPKKKKSKTRLGIIRWFILLATLKHCFIHIYHFGASFFTNSAHIHPDWDMFWYCMIQIGAAICLEKLMDELNDDEEEILLNDN